MNQIAPRPTLATPRREMILDAVKSGSGFDADIWHVMDERDNALIADEILHGAVSDKFVYNFEIAGTKVAGVSVVGARHLASHYGGLKHRIVATVEKKAALFIFTSYPSDERDISVHVSYINELADEPDFYKTVVEITDVKKGNSVQVETSETRFERRRDGSTYERPNFQKIAQSKAYRNAVLDLVPQDVVQKFKQMCLDQGKGSDITDSAIDAKRSGCLRFAAKNGIALDRQVVAALTWDQLCGLAESTKDGSDAFAAAMAALGLAGSGEEKAALAAPQQAKDESAKRNRRKAEAPAAQQQEQQEQQEQPQQPPARQQPAAKSAPQDDIFGAGA